MAVRGQPRTTLRGASFIPQEWLGTSYHLSQGGSRHCETPWQAGNKSNLPWSEWAGPAVGTECPPRPDWHPPPNRQALNAWDSPHHLRLGRGITRL